MEARQDPHPPSAAIASMSASAIADSLESGETTSAEIVAALLARIDAVDRAGPGLRSVLATAADALDVAAELDHERREGRVRGPLHGMPVLVKDNIEANGLPGTAGSLALGDRPPGRDAPLVARLRAAGAVVLGATNLSEWANIRSSESTSGWSAVGGLTGNPWALDRSAGGSSSGSGAAVAAGLAPLAVGTETDGSITCPSSFNGCVGLKPTVGLVPTRGVVPISASQDAPGPMARTVRDAALMLDALTDSSDCSSALGRAEPDTLRLAVADGLDTGHTGTDALFRSVVERLREAGARCDAVMLPKAEGIGEDELVVLLAELKDDLDAYLADRPGDGVRSLADVVAFNERHADEELTYFGQEFFERALTLGGRGAADYAAARDRCLRFAVEDCLAPVLEGDDAPDAFLAPGLAPAPKADLANGDRWFGGGDAIRPSAIAGWPIACLPMGLAGGLPVGLLLLGRPRSEARLLAVAETIERLLGLVDDGALAPSWRAPERG
jgi:amidase